MFFFFCFFLQLTFQDVDNPVPLQLLMCIYITGVPVVKELGRTPRNIVAPPTTASMASIGGGFLSVNNLAPKEVASGNKETGTWSLERFEWDSVATYPVQLFYWLL